MGDLKDNNNIKKSKCLESKRVRYSRNFNYKTYCNLIISPLIVTTMTTFTTYLLQLMANNDSLIHQKFIILNFSHKYQEILHLAFTCSKSILETPNNMWNMLKVNNNKDTRTKSLTSSWFLYC